MNKRVKSIVKRQGLLLVSVCMIIALCTTLSSCGAVSENNNNSSNTQQEQNREYMSKVNTVMNGLDTTLGSFLEAASRSDAVSMQTQCDKAMKQLDEVKNVEASDDLKDVKAKYDEGCEKLKQALTQYVDLVSSGEVIQVEKIKQIQQLYSEGYDALSLGDKAASEKK